MTLQQDWFKMVGNSELADVVLLVEGERFPTHRVMLAERSEYFRGLFLSVIQGQRSEGGVVQEIDLGQVIAGVLRVVLRYLYTAKLRSIQEYNSNIIRVEYTNRVVDVTCVWQSEARDTMKLLKLLPPDVSAELIEAMCL